MLETYKLQYINMQTFFISFISAGVTMALLDFVWLSSTMKTFYVSRIGHLFAPSFAISPAIVFYVLYSFGVAFLLVLPAINGGFSIGKVFLYGAVFGAVAYGTYDLTNQATLKGWPVLVTLVDIVWGAFLTGVVASASFYITKIFS